MQVIKSLKILSASQGQSENAHLVGLAPSSAQSMIDRVWWHEEGLSELAFQEGDHHWLWEEIADDYGLGVLKTCVAILSENNYLEGAMAYQFDAVSKLEKGAGAVYVGWLAAAPRNRHWLIRQPAYRGIGPALLYWAVRESYNAGLGGRISLESLPTPRTLSFYESRGFVRTDPSQPVSGLIDYELPHLEAIAWLRKEGDLR